MRNSYTQTHAGVTGLELRVFTSKHHIGQEDPSKRKEQKTPFSQSIGNLKKRQKLTH